MNTNIKKLKVALVAEELTQLGGAERVLDALLEIFPESPIYTLVWDKEKTQHKYDGFDVRPSIIQKLPMGVKKYKWYLTLMPLAAESFDLKEYDLVISSSSALIKGVKTNNNQLHICYCHTPTRYLWSDTKEYLKTAPIPAFIKPIMPFVISKLRKWDLKASKRPDFYIANANNIKNKIKKYYNRDADVIYPPIETSRFHVDKPDDYFLFVSRLEPYKKADLVIKAFKSLPNLKLVIAGSGTAEPELKKIATDNVSFVGRVSDKKLTNLFAKCLAFIFPPEEDFGIVPVEAMASGRPVIAFKKGGSLETVIAGETGEFFYPQTAEALAKTIANFKSLTYDPQKIRQHALKFDKEVFKKKIIEYINSKLKK